MWRMLYMYIIILYILYFTSKVDSLTGPKVVEARDGEFPFIASLRHCNGYKFCTGILITKKHVLTSEHCLKNKHPNFVRIAFGVTDLLNSTQYAVASWLTYLDWANIQNILLEELFHDIAIVTLFDNVNQPNVNPIRLSEWNKKQVQGKEAIIIGWKRLANVNLAQKSTVKIMRDEDVLRNMRLIKIVKSMGPGQRIMFTIAEPHILLEKGDSGGPLLDKFGALLGVNYGFGPTKNPWWNTLTNEFIQKYQMNLHFSIDYYRYFITSVTEYL